MSTNETMPIWRKGKKVILRPIVEADLPHFQTWINDPLNNQTLFVTWPVHEAGQRAWFETVTKSDRDNLTLAVTTHDGELIGNITITFDRTKQSAETGTLIGSHAHKGQGYATDAKMLILDYAFNWEGVRKVTSKIIDINGRSQKYAAATGHRKMATIEQEYFRNGRWCDEVLYVVFRDEWLPLWESYSQDLRHHLQQEALLGDIAL